MHISEGILSAPVLAGGAVLAAAGVAQGLRRMDDEAIPRVAVMSAGFFIASLIHVPVGVSSAHLILNGLCGLLLGWAAFPALLVALLLQGLVFGFGGLTGLGVNTVIMAAPAVGCRLLLGPFLRGGPRSRRFLLGAAAGGLAVAGSGLLAALALGLSDRSFLAAAGLLLGAHIPVMAAETVITGSVMVFLHRVRPELLDARPPAA